MPRLEQVRGGPQIQVQFVDLSWLQQVRLGERLAIAGAQDPIGENLRAPIGVHVHQLAGEVGITFLS